MEQNLFEELQEKKSKLITLATKARKFGWIDSVREKEIIDKLNSDVLTIGVIGQMKCGKSTFLNSFVFEDDVLPAATTPMTATLSVITYGEQKKIVAEFYTENEWEEQKKQAERSLQEVEGNTLEESKVKAAKELVKNSEKLGSNLSSYLGKTQDDSFENLIEYVGADGKYISITKSVTIYYPKEYLKGVEIVDTPGFNDPIVSREERTKEFLKKADVVLLMLYAGRPFDATDRDILFKNVSQCGTGRVLIGINKYDIPYQNGETEEEIKEYVFNQLQKACKECNDNLLIDILQSTEPIPLSAEMALLSQFPMTKISSNDAYDFAWKRNCDNFEISNQKQMRIKSHIDVLTSAVKKIVEGEKEKILFRKPINAIIAAGNKKKSDVDKNIQECNFLINALNQPDDELEDKLSNISKAKRRLLKKTDLLGDGIELELKNIVRGGRIQLEDSVESACKKMDRIIDSLGLFKGSDSIKPQLDRELQYLVSRTLKRNTEEIGNTARSKIKSTLIEFLSEAEDVLVRYIPDFDARDFIKSIEKELNLDIDNEAIFDYSNDANDANEENGFFEFMLGLLPLGGLLLPLVGHTEIKQKMHNEVNNIRKTDVTKFLDSVFNRKNEVIEKVKIRFIDELIEPLQEKINAIVEKREKREIELKTIQDKLSFLTKEKITIEEQLKEIV